jgi:uncharacterized protein with WD repeat
LQSIIVWDLRTGQKLRTFPTVSDEWPALRYSHDGSFLARAHEETIAVYQACPPSPLVCGCVVHPVC